MEINPNWPSDAAAFDIGEMKLYGTEEAKFKKGNIEKWDFSLIATILLFSNTCASEIKQRSGCKAALKKLRKFRNDLVGHPSQGTMSDAHFNYYWPRLSTLFSKVGADSDVIDGIKLRSGSVFYLSYLLELS